MRSPPKGFTAKTSAPASRPSCQVSCASMAVSITTLGAAAPRLCLTKRHNSWPLSPGMASSRKMRSTVPWARISRLRDAARWASKLGLRVLAGHGLNLRNVGPVAEIPEIEELNIGHSIVGRAVLVGFERAVQEMLTAIARKP